MFRILIPKEKKRQNRTQRLPKGAVETLFDVYLEATADEGLTFDGDGRLQRCVVAWRMSRQPVTVRQGRELGGGGLGNFSAGVVEDASPEGASKVATTGDAGGGDWCCRTLPVTRRRPTWARRRCPTSG